MYQERNENSEDVSDKVSKRIFATFGRNVTTFFKLMELLFCLHGCKEVENLFNMMTIFSKSVEHKRSY